MKTRFGCIPFVYQCREPCQYTLHRMVLRASQENPDLWWSQRFRISIPLFSGQPSTRKSVNHTSSREDAGRNVILCHGLVTRLYFLPFLQNVKRSVICSFLGGLSARNLRFYLSSDNLGCDPSAEIQYRVRIKIQHDRSRYEWPGDLIRVRFEKTIPERAQISMLNKRANFKVLRGNEIVCTSVNEATLHYGLPLNVLSMV